MKIQIKGTKIKILSSVQHDINKIINIENSNKYFIGCYNRVEHLGLLTDKDCIHLSIFDLKNDELVGYLLLFGLTDADKVLEFRRIAINKKGLGFGREAIHLIKLICFEKLKFYKLWLDVYADNQRAIQLYESEAFIFQGLLKDDNKTEKAHRPRWIYSILKDDYFKM